MNKLLLTVLFITVLTGCVTNINESNEVIEIANEESENNMILSIDGNELNVTWENNISTKALKELGELSIEMHRYGGFEQVGSIGHTLVSKDVNMSTYPGDIVLYSSNQLVIFFGTNSWSYTKLGHINLSQNELVELLDKPNVKVTIK